jgi:hypothetical protein
MSTALPEGTRIAEWGGFKLHDYLSAWQDQNLGRIAQHQFDRRDGAQSEDMGAAARVTRVTLLFQDSTGFAACRKFVDLWRQNKTRLLVHPIWGRYNATFIGIESGSLTIDQGANLYTVQGQFVESNINASTVADDSTSVPSKSGAVDAQADAVNGAVADSGFYTATTIATAAAYATAATTASAATLAAASTGTPNASVSSLLNTAITAGNATIAAIRAELDDAPVCYSAVAACEVLAAQLMDLGAAYLAQQPPLVEYVTGEAVPLLTVANLWYPGDAVNRLAEIRANNPALIGSIVPSGFRLQLASA